MNKAIELLVYHYNLTAESYLDNCGQANQFEYRDIAKTLIENDVPFCVDEHLKISLVPRESSEIDIDKAVMSVQKSPCKCIYTKLQKNKNNMAMVCMCCGQTKVSASNAVELAEKLDAMGKINQSGEDNE